MGSPPLRDDTDGTPRGLGPLLQSHGALQPGRGLVSGVLALALAILSALAVLAFHYPEYLTTPELRRAYDVEVLRVVLTITLALSGAIALTNVLLGRARWLAAWSLALVLSSLVLGGANVPVGEFPDHTPYLGLDFLVLDLLASALAFVIIEKAFALRKEQPIFRAEWQCDLVHFTVNHLLVGVVLLLANRALFLLAGTGTAPPGANTWWARLPLGVEALAVLLLVDVCQYWLHRAYHQIPWLWRFHAIHHSVKTMDWLAGSRQHIAEVVVTRCTVLALLYSFGFSRDALDVYVVVAGFQTVFNHANVSVRLGPLSWLIVTPNFHHWHHSQDDEGIDRNFAAHFAFLDYLFGTAVRAPRRWPKRYGVIGDDVPLGYGDQLAFPLIRGRKPQLPE